MTEKQKEAYKALQKAYQFSEREGKWSNVSEIQEYTDTQITLSLMRELVKKKSAVEKKSKKGILLKLFKPKSGAGGGMGGSGLFGPPSGYTPGGGPGPGYTPGGYPDGGYTPGGYTPPGGDGYTPGGTRGGTEGYQTTPPSGSDPLRSAIGLGILGAGLGSPASGGAAPYVPGGL